MGETLIVCPCWFIAIERLYWNFKLYCTTFFSKMCASKFGVRLIYGCGLYMDVYGNNFDIFLPRKLHSPKSGFQGGLVSDGIGI